MEQELTLTWEQRKLGELVQFSKGTGYSKGDLKESGTPIILYGRLYTKYETEITEVDTYVDAKPSSVYSCGGEVIVPASGETAEDISIASVVGKSGILLGGDLNIIMTPSELDSAFLAISISNGKPHDDMAKMAQGKSVVHLHNTDLEKIDLTYPSFDEQTRICAYFRQIDHLITLHQCKCKKLICIKKSMLENMFPQKGEKIPRVRFSGFTDDWEQRKVSEVADRFDNLRIPVSANLRVLGTTPYYGANGIQDYVEGFTHEGEFVLVAEDGANDLKNYPVKCVNGRIWVNNHAHVLQSKPEMADNKFLAYSISQADIEALLVGGGRAKLNAEIMMSIDLFLPSVQEQVTIGSILTRLDHLITLHQRKLKKLQNIKKAMLEKMFV